MDAQEYSNLLESIRFIYGYDFTEYAESSVRRRIALFMENRMIDTAENLGKILFKDEGVFAEFIQELSVTVTEMFRNPSFYRSVRERVIRRLATYPVIKIWIAGCATGEEVYSMAILLEEEGLLQRSIIYATDINQKSLHLAQQGIYSAEAIKAYKKNYQDAGGTADFTQYYSLANGMAVVDRRLQQNVVFAPHNLAADKSFNEFQLIICRNVLMYFNQNLQDKVIGLFYDSLCNLGMLGLGDKESLLFSRKKDDFEEFDRKEKIFMKIK